MSLPLTKNEYGFDINIDNPFVIFRYLNKIAVEKVGIENVLDLSRGDPGYGFAPNVRSRRFFSFLIALDTLFNNFETHFKDRTVDSEIKILGEIEKFARTTYVPNLASELLNDLEEFFAKVILSAKNQNLKWNKFDVLFQLFKYATVSGGCYHDPYGELISRVVVADYHTQQLGMSIKYDDLIFTAGASHAIGTFFKAFGVEGAGFLKEGDNALITSPVYFPYMGILETRGATIHTLSVDPNTGQFSKEAFTALGDLKPKIIFLVDPDNPTGFAKNEESLRALAEYAEKVDALILTDEVYFAFHSGRKSILNFAPKRTIRIDARSKIERATGCRFGEYIITNEANEYLSKNLLKKYLPEGSDLRTYLHDAKAPGGVKGEFRHTTFVPGPGQILGICHMILGEAERNKYLGIVKENMQSWHEGLGLEWKGSFYYSLFNLNEIANDKKKTVSAERKMLDLAERGVVLIPANRFFSKAEREARDCTNFMRASLPNLTLEQVKKAAGVIREYLQA